MGEENNLHFGMLSLADIQLLSPETRNRLASMDEYDPNPLSQDIIDKILNLEDDDESVEDFTPHEITVDTNEDIVSKLLLFLQNGNKEICVLSANGSVSCVTIKQPDWLYPKTIMGYNFKILSLTGSYHYGRSKKDGLSISLLGPDGKTIFGGSVAGPLTSEGPVKIIVGSFKSNDFRKRNQYKRRMDYPDLSDGGMVEDGPVDSATSMA